MRVTVVGGGLAGAAAALRLARAGEPVRLFEREAAPRHKICGEFLSGEACAMLESAGIDLARLGAAPIGRLRLVAGGRTAEAALPFRAVGLTRRRLDAALLDAAAAAGARVQRGVTVRAFEGGELRTDVGAIAPGTLLLASGKHEVRGARRDTAGCRDGDVGFKSYWRLAPGAAAALAGHIEVILFAGGYAGLQMVEGGVANLCLLVTRERLAAAGGDWPALLAWLLRQPHLARRLDDAEPLLDKPLTIAGVPYGYRPARVAADERCYRLGDQAAVIPSFCGDGMAIALHSARLAAEAVLAAAPPATYHRRLAADLEGQFRWAAALQRIGDHPPLWPPALALLARAPALLAAFARATRLPARALTTAQPRRAV